MSKHLVKESLPVLHTVEFTPESLQNLFETSELSHWIDAVGTVADLTEEEEIDALMQDAEEFCERVNLDAAYAPVLVKAFLEGLEDGGTSPDLE